MSKNFELLKEVGGEEGLFRTSGPPTDYGSAADGEPNPELDKTARDTVLRNATLPDVLQIPEVPALSILCAATEVSSGLDEESRQKSLHDKSPGEAFRTAKNPTNRIGAPAISPDPHRNNGNQQTARHSSPSSTVSQWAHIPISPLSTVSPEALPELDKMTPKKSPGRNSSALRWIGSLLAGSKSWKGKVRAQSKPQGLALESIALEEEIKLVRRVFPGAEEDSPRVALFSGVETESGCASICARTAELLAARGEGPVCIVDANFVSPSLHQCFGVENMRGLAEATLESGPIHNFVQQIPEPDLWLMTSGKGSKQLSTSAIVDGLRVRIAELRAAFRYVVIHAGPLRRGTTALPICRWTDGVVLVVEANCTRRESAKRIKENLLAANVRLLGVVLNNRTFPIPEVIYRRL